MNDGGSRPKAAVPFREINAGPCPTAAIPGPAAARFALIRNQ